MTKTKIILGLLLIFFAINSCKKVGDYVEDDNYIPLNMFTTDSSNFITFESSNHNPLQDYSINNIIISNLQDYNDIILDEGYCLKPEVDFNNYYVIGIKGPDNLFLGAVASFFTFETVLKKNETNYVFEISTTQFSKEKSDESLIYDKYRILWYAFPKKEDGSKVLVNQKYKFIQPDDNNLQEYCGDYKGFVKHTFSSNEMACSDTILTLKFDKPQLPNNNYKICKTPIILAEYDDFIAGYSYAYKINNIIHLEGSCDSGSWFGNEETLNYIDISNNTIVITLDCGIFYGKKI